MLKRTISGAVFIAIIVGFLVLHKQVDYRLFQILNCFFMVGGTFELARAVSPYTSKGSFILSIVFGVLFVPTYAVVEYWLMPLFGWLFALALIVLFALIFVCCVKALNLDKKGLLVSLFTLIYPALFILAMVVGNDLSLGFTVMLLTFVISPCTDTFAYLVGSLIGGKKLCPKLSPKKTISGAIGGLVGGIVGSILAYIIFEPQVNFFSPILLFILVGIGASVLTQVGDLFESYIKRKVGIKDMGKIMPGHGGVLDRIDGTLFASAFLCIVFALV